MISIVIISKDESALDETLTELEVQLRTLESSSEEGEIVVVDASRGRLDYIRDKHAETVRWLDFQGPPEVRVTIPHQRNVGVKAARGDIVVFTDAGCLPQPGWLESMVGTLRKGESVVAGVSQGLAGANFYDAFRLTDQHPDVAEVVYLKESATLNFAFLKEVFDAVDGFDESFAYGSDVDFSWRLNDIGYRIRLVPEAVIEHDYGTRRRQRRRSYIYGKARARLYRKHKDRRRTILRNDPIAVVYPLFILGLPLTLVFPVYPLLLVLPAWRNRSRGAFNVLVDHLLYGAGVLAELARL